MKVTTTQLREASERVQWAINDVLACINDREREPELRRLSERRAELLQVCEQPTRANVRKHYPDHARVLLVNSLCVLRTGGAGTHEDRDYMRRQLDLYLDAKHEEAELGRKLRAAAKAGRL